MRELYDRTMRWVTACANSDVPRWQFYVVALSLPLVAALPYLDAATYMLWSLLAVTVCAFIGGTGPALAATGVAVLYGYIFSAALARELPALSAQVMLVCASVLSSTLITLLRGNARPGKAPARHALQEAFSLVFDHVPVALMIVRLSDGQLVAVNSAFSELWGYTRDQALGRTSAQLALWVESAQLIQKLKANRHSDTQELQVRTSASEIRDVLACVRPIHFENAAHLLVTATDVTDSKRVQELEHIALHDTLTNLPNRRLLQQRLQRSTSRATDGKLSAMLLIDLDGFKQVNDTLGHAAGDELLRLVALRMKNRIRTGDLLARLGGDEFVVLLENLPVTGEAESVALELLRNMSMPFVLVNGREVGISASIGISYFNAGAADEAAGAFLHADSALYAAKRAGRNTMRISPAAAVRRKLSATVPVANLDVPTRELTS